LTELVFREDAYARSCDATVVGITERGGILLDRTVFYAAAGGQPGDRGVVGGVTIATTVYDEAKTVVHVPAEGQVLPAVGDVVRVELDWGHRYRVMRCHSLMHLLCASVPFPVTGSSITDDGGRIDFDIPEGQVPEKVALGEKISALIKEDHVISTRLISDDELDANPHLVRTMFVKPPRGSGVIRLVMIGEDGKVDLQPCGGTHVLRTGEIGNIVVAKIENKGKINRRIRLQLVSI
jgi:misacylated tRNA(Ala) deacylase